MKNEILKISQNKALKYSLMLILGLVLCFSNIRLSYADSEADLFTVSNIAVDVTADTASKARDDAMNDVRVNAFNKILKRILLPQDLVKLPEFLPEQIFSMIKEVTVIEEKTSAVRYIAKLSISFDGEAIKKMLSEAFVPFIVETSNPSLILPIYSVSGKRSLLWEESNPWFKLWSDNVSQAVVVPMVMPYGELLDISTLSASKALRYDDDALTAIAQNYNVDNIFIVRATSYEGLEARVEVEVSSYNVKTKQKNVFEQPITIYREPDDDFKQVLKQALNLTIDEIENKWKEEKSVFFSIDSNMILIAKTETLANLNKIIKMLEKIPLVQNLQVQATTKDKVQLNLSFAGNISNIINNIAKNGYDAEFNRGYWILKKQSSN
ncbi:MAG: DUF2066 domain-containing protein [Alphaproteobacteria bacterium]